jgi:hypothetical protein
MAAHASLTGANLHECKGFDTATAGQVRVADGAGSGTMQKIGVSEIDTADIFNTNSGSLNAYLADVSTASTVYVVIPFACTITKVSSAIAVAITVANSIVTISNNADASMGTITIAFTGSVAGDVDTLTPASNNTFTAGQRMKITTDGGSTTVSPTHFTIEYTRTA